MIWFLKVVIILLLALQAVADTKRLLERWLPVDDVIKTIHLRTVTSCFLECIGNSECATIGFDFDPSVKKNGECKLLKKDYGKLEEDKGLTKMFIFVDPLCDGVSPDCQNCDNAMKFGLTTANLKIRNNVERVGCERRNGTTFTTFNHDAESVRYFDINNYDKWSKINYENSIRYVWAATSKFKKCRQRFYITSTDVGADKTFFGNIYGLKMSGYHEDCVGCDKLMVNSDDEKSGWAWIENKVYLPVFSMKFGDTNEADENLNIRLSKFECWDE